MNRKEHWDRVYSAKSPVELTWFQERPTASLELIGKMGLGPEDRVFDVGGGTSLLPSFLLDEGYQRLSVLDVSGRALATAKDQLGPRAEGVEWFEADLLTFEPPHQWALWHDRAVFHFLTSQEDREAYCRVLDQGLEAAGHLIIATFAPDGPLKCSGLDCVRYSPESLHSVLGSEYDFRGSLEEAPDTFRRYPELRLLVVPTEGRVVIPNTALRHMARSSAALLLVVHPVQAQQAELIRHAVYVDGHPLAVWEKSPADPDGTIILIHGRTWSSLPDFDLQLPGEELSLMDGLVAEGYATYAVDLRGYGATPRDETGWLTPDRAALDMVGVLQWVGERTGDLPALFGWSYGSMVAQLTAQRRAELMGSLILFGYPVNPDFEYPQGATYPDAPPRTPTTAEAAASDFIIPGSISRRAIDEYVRHALEADPIRVDWRDLADWNELDPAEVHVPTLLIQGEKDPLAPSARQAAFFSRLGTADRTWVTIPGGDHAAHLETPRPKFIYAMVSFLRQPR